MDLLLQLQADQLGVTVRRPVDQETTALGAAYLAGLAEGVACSTIVAARWQLGRVHAGEPTAAPPTPPTSVVAGRRAVAVGRDGRRDRSGSAGRTPARLAAVAWKWRRAATRR